MIINSRNETFVQTMRVVADDELCVLVGPWFLEVVNTVIQECTCIGGGLDEGQQMVASHTASAKCRSAGLGNCFRVSNVPSRDMMIWQRSEHVYAANVTEYFAASVVHSLVSLFQNGGFIQSENWVDQRTLLGRQHRTVPLVMVDALDRVIFDLSVVVGLFV